MAAETTLAILFADISGSTRLYETLGDQQAREVVAGCLAVLARATLQHGGTVVKTIGDELMATFPAPDIAVAAAVAMQDAVTGMPPAGGRRMAIKVGMHHGQVVAVSGDVFGDAVNVAARMTSQAKGGEILTTGTTVAQLRGSWQNNCRQIGWIEVKGKAEPVEICEVVWQAEEATTMRAAPLPKAAVRPAGGLRMVLSAGGVRVELSERNPALTLGRSDEVSLTVPFARVSRQHAKIELRQGRVLLTDQSANGTFVLPDGGFSTFVHRDACELRGSGTLGLGEEPSPGSNVRVRYDLAN